MKISILVAKLGVYQEAMKTSLGDMRCNRFDSSILVASNNIAKSCGQIRIKLWIQVTGCLTVTVRVPSDEET